MPDVTPFLEAFANFAARYASELREGRVCPRCHAQLAGRQRIGRSLYALPCGHLLGRLLEESAPR